MSTQVEKIYSLSLIVNSSSLCNSLFTELLGAFVWDFTQTFKISDIFSLTSKNKNMKMNKFIKGVIVVGAALGKGRASKTTT